MNDSYVEQLRHGLLDWRTNPRRGCSLSEPLDPARDHIVGDPGSAIGVVEYACHGSPAGSREDRALRAPLRTMLEQGRICFALRHFPMIDGYAHAWEAACAVEAADLQGAFWELHEAIGEAVAQLGSEPVGPGTIVSIARELGLDIERLQRDMDLPAIGDRVLHDFRGGVRSGVNGAPTFYVAGIRQIIERPEELVGRLERALAGDLAALWPPHVRS